MRWRWFRAFLEYGEHISFLSGFARGLVVYGPWVLGLLATIWAQVAGMHPIGVFLTALATLALAAFIARSIAYWRYYVAKERAVTAQPAPRTDQSPQMSDKAPELRVELLGARVFTPGADHMKDTHTGLAVAARIWNTGGASVALGWRLGVAAPGASWSVVECVEIPQAGLKLGGKESVFIGPDACLATKSLKNPVPTMPPLGGTLLFYPRVARALIAQDETRLTLFVRDIYGKETVEPKRVGDWNTSEELK